MNQGFVITAIGWDILAKAVSGEHKLKIAGVAFGDGRIAEGENPATYTGLKHAIADGTTSEVKITTQEDASGVVNQSTVSFVVEYRSDFNGPCPITNIAPVDIETDFNLNEFAVYAEDPSSGDYVPIYYATLGDNPHPVTSHKHGAIDIRRYPVSIVISSDIEVALIYPPLAFVTAEEMRDYAINTCKPLFLDLSQKQVDEHNVDLEAHMNLRNYLASNDKRITALEKLLSGDNASPFRGEFKTLDAVVLTAGVYNQQAAIVEF